MSWKSIKVSKLELDIGFIFTSGQNFLWKLTNSTEGEWTGVISGNLINLKQDKDTLFYRLKASNNPSMSKNPDKLLPILEDFFQLNLLNLQVEYESWKQKDSNFKLKSVKLDGLRMLRQDPLENCFSFICSSNNNVKRITKMLNSLCQIYGDPIGEEYEGQQFYTFPDVKKLTPDSVESKLRELGFGYRAKYINKAAKLIHAKNLELKESWLHTLRSLPYEEVHNALIEIPGVGPKVADCICLMSMDKHEAIPIDTHIWQIATKDYKLITGKTKTLTKSNYTLISNHFRNLWGPYAGWAHSVLFTYKMNNMEKDDAPPSKKAKVEKVKVEVEVEVEVKEEVKEEE